MSGRLARLFGDLRARRAVGLIGYLPVGFPSLALTPALAQAALEGGADAIELGIPFSDPVADGPSIQRASVAALRAGASVPRALEAAHACRQQAAAPLIFMSYYNPILAYGEARFAEAAARAGIDGVIVVDLPASEAQSWCAAARGAGVDTIFLVAPTSGPDRINAAARASTGFLYCVTLTGTTGARAALDADAFDLLRRARDCTSLPLVAGFGISRAEHIRALQGHGDAAVVGSALVDAVSAAAGDGAARAARALMAGLKPGTVR